MEALLATDNLLVVALVVGIAAMARAISVLFKRCVALESEKHEIALACANVIGGAQSTMAQAIVALERERAALSDIARQAQRAPGSDERA